MKTTTEVFPVSVVIPVYNRAQTITYCLDSVCDQTVPPFEVIVVDDCSSDATVKIVNNYGRLHPLVRCVVLERNSGAQAARNRGIKEACGEWIAFQDSDDEWLTDKLEKQISALEESGVDPLMVVHTDCFRYDHQTSEKKLWTLPTVEGEKALQKLLVAAGPMFQGMMTSKVALEKIGLLDEKVPSYQEWDTAIGLAKVCRFIHLHDPLFVYHLHAGDTISKNKVGDVEGYQYVVDKHRADILRVCGNEVLNRHLETNALKAVRWGLYTEAKNILEKTVGNSVHIALLKGISKEIISLRAYDIAVRVFRRMRLIQ